MTDLIDTRYTIEDRQLIAETPDLRVQILTVANNQEVRDRTSWWSTGVTPNPAHSLRSRPTIVARVPRG